MAVFETILTTEDKKTLRRLDAQRAVAQSGNPNLKPSDAVAWIMSYMAFLEELHEQYDLNPEEMYEFDMSCGAVYKV